MGLALGELSRLVTEAAYYHARRKTMNDKQMGVVRHVMTAVGAVAVYMGWTDDATWVMVAGAMSTMLGFVWSWMSKVE